MKNLYDDQNFWVDRVKMAKLSGKPNDCVWTGDWYRIVDNRKSVIQSLIPPTAKVLDAGCGYGWLSQEIENDYVGIDQTVALVNYGKELYPDVNLILHKLQELPFEDNSFDWVVSSCVKEGIVGLENNGSIETGRWSKIQSELLRVAKQGIIWPSYSNEYEIIKR